MPDAQPPPAHRCILADQQETPEVDADLTIEIPKGVEVVRGPGGRKVSSA